MDTRDLSFLTITEAARLVRSHDVSPVELVEATLARIDAHDGDIRAFAHVDWDGARAAVRGIERLIGAGEPCGALCGVPLAIKDIVDVAALPTTAGSRVLAGNIASDDAPLVAAIRAAGGVILGKSNTHEFAYGIITAPTRNPWDRARLPGGSSGGSAAALAAGMALGAVGTDTAGSIRLPAALCGGVGFKPTYGLVDCRGVIPLSWSLDHAGPMTRSVADAALLLSVIAPRFATAVKNYGGALAGEAIPRAFERPVRGLRAGIPRGYFYENLDPAVAAAVDVALGVLADLGMEMRDVELPDVALTFAVGRAVQRPEASAYHRASLRATPELYGDETRRDLELGELYLATDYVHAQRVRALLRQRWLDVMDDVDLLVTPTVPIPAPPIPVDQGASSGAIKSTLLHNTYPFNLAGFPALSLPCGFTPGGLPVGLQIVGRPGEDATVLHAGYAYEGATAWHTMRPAL